MKVVVIGGTGHIGSFLVPRLVRAGHTVVSVSRGQSAPYTDGAEWSDVRSVVLDRDREDSVDGFGRALMREAPEPDVVVDLVCFTLASAASLVRQLRGETGHLVHCGSIWRYGASRSLPITESDPDTEPPEDEYGLQKDQIARMLKEETAGGGLVTTSLHPGHIVGPGWAPIGPLGNLDPSVWMALSAGNPLRVPGDGTQLLHHVHADDVAQAFEKAIDHRSSASGEDFNVTASTALSVRGYLSAAASWFGQSANWRSVSWESYRDHVGPIHAQTSWDHLHRSQCFSITKAATLLGYQPVHRPADAILEAVRWLVDHHQLHTVRPTTASGNLVS